MTNNKNAKIRVQWSDRTENYSRENKIKIRNDFAKKYGVEKHNIQVNFTAVKLNDKGEQIEIKGATIENIMDPNYQKGLFKEWLTREQIEIDEKRIMKLDDLINSELDSDFEASEFNKWELKSLKLNNFLSYGSDNKLDMGKYAGLTLVSSEPANMGGKTSLAVDSLKFLFFGKTTKTDKNEEIFNTFTDEKELSVKGHLVMGGDNVIIERKLTRTAKKGGGWSIKSFLNFYKIMPDGEEVLFNDEDAIKTTASIKKMIGKEEDFDITVLSTGRNLEDLIDATPTENGKLLNKFIGLEVIEVKELIARKKYNEFNGKKTSNIYNPIVLMEENEQMEENLEIYEGLLETHKENLNSYKAQIVALEAERETLFTAKTPIDVNLDQLNEEKINADLTAIKLKGETANKELAGYVTRLAELVGYEYNEEKFTDLQTEKVKNMSELEKFNNRLEVLNLNLTNLVSGEICQTCNRKLDDVDHSVEIMKLKAEIEEITTKKLVENAKTLALIEKDILALNDNKLLVTERDLLEIKKDRLEVDILSLKKDYVSRASDLKKFKANEKAIKDNLLLDSKIDMVKTNIVIHNTSIEDVLKKINGVETLTTVGTEKIKNNKLLLDKITSEIAVERIFKTYIEMVGKKGVGKLVLRSVLPIINSELSRLLDDVVDFEVELIINAKNEVEFLIRRGDTEKNLKSGSGFERTMSSIALRCVLSKISHLPSPNFITFDEALGKVSPDNYDKVRILFDKIKTMFDVVFLIVQDRTFSEWSDSEINIKKDNLISRIL